STVPSEPAKLPRITLTRSPRRTCTLARPEAFPARLRPLCSWPRAMSNHLRRERNALHEPLLAQRPAHRPADPGRPRLPRVVGDDRRLLVAPDVRSVPTAHLLGRPHHDRLRDIALLHRPVGQGILDRDHDRIAHPGITPPRAAQHANALRSLGARVVGDLHHRFLLDHRRLTWLVRG